MEARTPLMTAAIHVHRNRFVFKYPEEMMRLVLSPIASTSVKRRPSR